MTGSIRSYFGLAWKLTLFVALLVAASYAGNWVKAQLNLELTPSTEPLLHRVIMTATTVYVFLMMLPFVPGISKNRRSAPELPPPSTNSTFCGRISMQLWLSGMMSRCVGAL